MDASLYFDLRGQSAQPFQFYIGGRGIGKTYSALRLCTQFRFLYLRHSETEIELACSEAGNAFKAINRDFNRDIHPTRAGKDIYCFKEGEKLLGYGASVSTFFNKRGVDLSDVDLIYFDEFIPERLKLLRAGYGETLVNLYETVNRNRELYGKPPCTMICTSNALSLSNEILTTFGLVKPLYNMARTGQIKYTDPDRGIYLWYCEDHAISRAKKHTALSKALARDNDAGIDQRFRFEAKTNYNARNFVPYASYNGFVVHRHKSACDILVTYGIKHPAKYKFGDLDAAPFKERVAWLVEDAAEQGKLYYDNETTMIMFGNLMK